jgi:sec-independent protein translocase protein TatA
MNIFGIGLPEMAVIAAIGLLVFGPKRLPEIGKTLGRTLRGFQSASQEFEKEFRTAVGTDQPIDISGPPAAIPPAADSATPAAVVEESAAPSTGPTS